MSHRRACALTGSRISTGTEGTGFTPLSVTDPNGDYGRSITLKAGNPSANDPIAPGWYNPVIINPTEGPGGAIFEDNIATCDSTRIEPGDLLETEPGMMTGPTNDGLTILMAQENATAHWDNTLNAPVGCILNDQSPNQLCVKSARMVAIPVYNPDEYDSGRASGRQVIQITKVIGFWIEGIDNTGNITGKIMYYPTTWNEGDGIERDSAFVIQIALVR